MLNKQRTKRTCLSAFSGYFMAVLLALSILYALQFALKPTRTERVIRILCFGDSLTTGSGSDNKDHPYSTKLQEYFDVHDQTVQGASVRPIFEVHNAGMPGERAKDEMLPRLNQILRGTRLQYNWVIILGGTNDMRKYYENISLQFDIDDSRSIFHALVELHNTTHAFGARSVAVSIPDRECKGSGTCSNLKETLQKINELLRDFTSHNKEKVILADLASEVSLPRDKKLWSDQLHFTQQGYEKMANVIYNSMKEHV
ncbi:hypothetical protein OS493_026844 [Desmophyllum pertusum]|uniref:SGNH hydrolase-type esterase domain-containing protein n=1 Tax=Desmophyllum pertusum TaxID=174260 RepID=A0A9W9ZL08_9CNID|nr:hypothetical protein OS493_026844 [Desmophyllum pertusum]